MLLISHFTQWLAAVSIFILQYDCVDPSPSLPDLYEASILELQAGLDAKQFTSVDLVKTYFARIEEVNFRGPALRAILEINPSALEQAGILDTERAKRGKRGNLHGIPVLLKDNMATDAAEGMNTTAGSYSLLGSVVPDEAGVVKRLRKAGAILLGKANLCEFSHARGEGLANGWSGRGGQTTGAYYKNADPCGSSSGSAVAASIGLTAVALGTETDSSIVCPASHNNLVGIKPTVGLTSRAGVIPNCINQDTVGPIARSLADATIVLSAIAGKDPNDNFTLSQPNQVPDFTKALDVHSLVGKRIGVPRRLETDLADPAILVVFEQALNTLQNLGATIVDPADLPSIDEIVISKNETVVAHADLKDGLNAWYQGLLSNPSGVRSLADLVMFNKQNPSLEMPVGYEDQSYLIDSEATVGFDPEYFDSLHHNHDLGRTRGIDAALRINKLDTLVLPATVASGPAAIAGYPIVTVPMGFFPENTPINSTGPRTVYPGPGIPFGLSFVGTAFSEFALIEMAYAYEQKTKVRLQRRAYQSAVPRTQLSDVIIR